jgi:DNA-binding winged helix-turn-helix (wHTH) protein/tetratricopeptide (TPR) repeat protein
LLTLLLRQAGEVVSREAIRDSLWDAQTTVDFELGMNRCVRELRGALLDDANSSVYIQTVPRRGYCFIAPVSGAGSHTQELEGPAAPDAPVNPSGQPVSIVVLPFANLGTGSGPDDHRDEYFGDGLAEEITNALVQITGLRVMPRTTLPKAAAAARRALELDETDGDAHAALGEVAAMLDYDWSAAAYHFRRARELSSGTNVRLRYLLWYLLPQGRMDEAVAESHDIMTQDPLFPLAHTSKANALFLGGAYKQAAECCLRALTKQPDFSPALQSMVAIRAREGHFEEALAWAQRLVDIVGRSYVSLSSLGLAHAAAGNFQTAHRLLQEMNLQSHGASGFATAMACIHALLGEKDAAFQWMNRAVARRDPRLLWVRTLPWLDSLRSEPSFLALLSEMNLHAAVS